MKHVRWMVLGVFVCLAAGCMDNTTEVTVKKDGSGTITNTAYMSPQSMSMMAMGAQQAGGEGDEAMKAPDPIEQMKDEAKNKAASFGEGVTFVEATEATSAKGWKGVKAVYTYDDITKVKLSPDMTPKGPGEQDGGEDKDFITFGFKSGSPAVLSILLAQNKVDPDMAPADAEEAGDDDIPPGMEAMFDGMRMAMHIKVDGTMKATNAMHKLDSGDGVTLMDVDVGKMIKDREKFKAMKNLDSKREGDKEKIREALKDMPYVKVELEDEIEIQFE